MDSIVIGLDFNFLPVYLVHLCYGNPLPRKIDDPFPLRTRWSFSCPFFLYLLSSIKAVDNSHHRHTISNTSTMNTTLELSVSNAFQLAPAIRRTSPMVSSSCPILLWVTSFSCTKNVLHFHKNLLFHHLLFLKKV